MKNLFIKTVIIFVIVFLQSCGVVTPKINDRDHPFIVESIEQVSTTHSKYNSKSVNTQVSYLFSTWTESIILPTGMFNVGDTIKLYKYEK